jgi:branched-chain amino acid transport system substrate-binding protein
MEERMKRLLAAGAVGIVLAAASVTAGNAEDTVKVGLILSYSGQFADTAAQMDNAIKLYVKQHGDTVAGKRLEFIRKDTGGIAPDVAKRLAQELIVRDHADIIAGFALTPNALAAADVSAEAKKFMVVMNAATSIITTKSPYIARTSVTTPWSRTTVPGSMRKPRFTPALRKRAARSPVRFVSRSPIRIFPPLCSAPRT